MFQVVCNSHYSLINLALHIYGSIKWHPGRFLWIMSTTGICYKHIHIPEVILANRYPDVRVSWRTDTLAYGYLDEQTPWRTDTLTNRHPDVRTPWRTDILINGHPDMTLMLSVLSRCDHAVFMHERHLGN